MLIPLLAFGLGWVLSDKMHDQSNPIHLAADYLAARLQNLDKMTPQEQAQFLTETYGILAQWLAPHLQAFATLAPQQIEQQLIVVAENLAHALNQYTPSMQAAFQRAQVTILPT